MKPLKAAAVLAGSLVAVGAAAPAFADDLTPSSLNGGIDTITRTGLKDPGQLLSTNALDSEKNGSLINSVKDVTEGVNKTGATQSLLGGLPFTG